VGPGVRGLRLKRREFIALAGGIVVWPAASRSQSRPKRIAIFHPSIPVIELSQNGPHPQWHAFFNELERLGFTEGHNLEIERYSGEGRSDKYVELAEYIVGRNPDVIFAMTTRVVQYLARATKTIPIVGVTSDAVAAGLASSVAKPGGNVTGVTDPGYEIMGKRFEILRELVPNAVKIGFLGPKAFWQTGLSDHVEGTAKRAGVILIKAALGSPIDRMEYALAFAALHLRRSASTPW
jgi:putative ABC transport system substrate-binding protein